MGIVSQFYSLLARQLSKQWTAKCTVSLFKRRDVESRYIQSRVNILVAPINVVFLLYSLCSPRRYPKKLFDGLYLASQEKRRRDFYKKLRLLRSVRLSCVLITNYLRILFFHLVILNCSAIMDSKLLQLFSLSCSLSLDAVSLFFFLFLICESLLRLKGLFFYRDCFFDTISLLWYELGLVYRVVLFNKVLLRFCLLFAVLDVTNFAKGDRCFCNYFCKLRHLCYPDFYCLNV